MFNPLTMIDVAKEQQKDRLKEAQTARLLQSAPAVQPEVETQQPSRFNHALQLVGWHFKKQPYRI